jgi:hypothetical protein
MKIIKIIKIIKVAQWGKPIPKNSPIGTQNTSPEQELTQTLSLTPQISKILKQVLNQSGLNKQKILPFLQNLFAALGNVPLSQIQKLVNDLGENQEI